jgi:hypothetical protein
MPAPGDVGVFPTTAPRAVTVASARPSPSPRRVLIVDDEPLVAAMLADVVSMLGYEGQVATNGSDALRLASEFGPDARSGPHASRWESRPPPLRTWSADWRSTTRHNTDPRPFSTAATMPAPAAGTTSRESSDSSVIPIGPSKPSGMLSALPKASLTS